MFARYFSIYIDFARGSTAPLLAGLSSTSPAALITWVAKDNFKVRIYFAERGSTELEALSGIQISGSDQLVLSAHPASNPNAADFLFSATGFTVGGSAGAYYYEADLDLNTTALLTAVGAISIGQLPVIVTLQDQNALNTSRYSFRFLATIFSPGVTGTEGVPVSGSPPYPLPEALAAKQDWTDTAFLSADGDDDNAILGDPGLPYSTTQAAWDAGAKVMVLFPAVFVRAGFTSSTEVLLTVIGFGADQSAMGEIVAPAGANITGNGQHLVTFTNIQTSPNTLAVGDAAPAGTLVMRGCRVIAINAIGGTGVDTGALGGDGGTVTLLDCDVQSTPAVGGGFGPGGDGAVGALVAERCRFANDQSGTYRDCLIAGAWRSIIEAPAVEILTFAEPLVINCSPYRTSQNAQVTFSGDCEITFTGSVNGMSGILLLLIDTAGDHEITLPASSFINGVPTASFDIFAAAARTAVLRWLYDGTNYHWALEPVA